MGNMKIAHDEQTAKLLMKQFKDVGRILTAIGDPTRQLIMAVLASNECKGMRVGDITLKTHLSRPAVSHHLKILLDAEVIGMIPQGTKHFYHLLLGGKWPTLVSLINHIEALRSENVCEEE